MSRLALAALALGIANPALANMPPVEYDHPYAGTLERHLVPYGAAWAKCNAISLARGEGGMPVSSMRIGNRSLYGCAFGGKLDGQKRCVVVYSFDTPALARKQHRNYDTKMKSNVFRHEQGHCNGWPSWHPDALP
jgi:hypothetical protein